MPILLKWHVLLSITLTQIYRKTDAMYKWAYVKDVDEAIPELNVVHDTGINMSIDATFRAHIAEVVATSR